MNTLDVEQRSGEWLAARVGMVTASRVADAIAMLKKGGESAARRSYRYELAAEILTGRSIDHYVSPAMEYGIENEPLARTAYEILTGNDVKQIGLALHPTIARGAASPDGLIGGDGLVEFKVPSVITHLEYFEAGVVPEEYKPQMFWQMACCGPERKWNDFCSHCPILPSPYDTFICRLPRNDERIAEMEAAVVQFLNDVEATLATLTERTGGESVIEKKLRQSITQAHSRKHPHLVGDFDYGIVP